MNKIVKILLHIAILIVFGILMYYPALGFDFINWDDPKTILSNKLIWSCSFDSLKQLFSIGYWTHYQPITYFSMWLENCVWGIDAKHFHITQIVIHLLNTLLLYGFISTLFMYKSNKNALLFAFVGSLLFLFHPMKPESVAWCAERKDLVYSFFMLLQLLLYAHWKRKGKKLWPARYLCMFGLFVLAILSKSTAVVIPMVLLVMDVYWFEEKIGKAMVKYIPFFLMAIGFAYFSMVLNKSDQRIFEFQTYYNFYERIANAAFALLWYVWHFFIPINLSAIYPFYDLGHKTVSYWKIILVFVEIGVFAGLWYRRKNSLLFCYCFFILNLFPSLQLIPFGRVLVADRYLYISGIALIMLILMACQYATNKWTKIGVAFWLLPLVLLLVNAIYFNQRLQVWANSEVFWNDVIQKSPDLSFSYLNRGNYYAQKGNYPLARQDFNKVLTLQPENMEAKINLSNIHYAQGNLDLAILNYRAILSEIPDNNSVRINMIIALYQNKEYTAALNVTDAGLILHSNNADLIYYKALLLNELNDKEAAIKLYQSLLNSSRRSSALKKLQSME